MRSSRRRRPTYKGSPSTTCSVTSWRSCCRANRTPVAKAKPSDSFVRRDLKIALVHDYLNQRGGAERVFRHIADLYPGAPIYTSLFDSRVTGDLVSASRVRTSPLALLPGSSHYFRYLAPFYPAAFEGFDLSAYDVVVSTTTAWAKGVRFRPDAVHVCYIHTVSRFAFAYDQYLGGFGIGGLVRPLVDRLAAWDRSAAQRPTAFIANSHNVAARVRHYYGRESLVAHCPVDVDRFAIGAGSGPYALVVSRLLPYKRIDRAIAACALAGVPLKIVGAGPAERALRVVARGTQTEFLGSLPDAALREVMGEARVVILPGEEDYGLVPLEANASGRPALAYGAGGALETIRPGVTGAYFAEPSAESLATALAGFDARAYDPRAMRSHAESFGPEPFKRRFAALVDDVVSGRLRAPAASDVVEQR